MPKITQTPISDLFSELLYDLQLDIENNLLSTSFTNRVLRSILNDTASDLLSRIDFKYLFIFRTINLRSISNLELVWANLDVELEDTSFDVDFLRLINAGMPVSMVATGDNPFTVYGIDTKDTSQDAIPLLVRPQVVVDEMNALNILMFSKFYYRLNGSTIKFWTHIANGSDLSSYPDTLNIQICYIMSGWIHDNATPHIGKNLNSLNSDDITSSNIDTFFTGIPKDLLIGGARWRWLKSRGKEYESYYSEHEQRIQDYYGMGYDGAIS